MTLRDDLDGKKIGLTGVTGFVGEALMQRILTDLPGTTVVAMVRRKGSVTAVERVEQLLKRKTFDQAREPFGGDATALREARVAVVEGDLAHLPDLPADLDVLIHCAGDVSFDPAIDEAFQTNVLGTQALVEKMLVATEGRCHYVHISTAYVSGRRRGAILEGPVQHEVDWQIETRWGLGMREHIEETSRTPGQLGAFLKPAERDHGRAGPLSVSEDAERRRKEWVKKRLVDAGGERAHTLGWTDCYTFTKALGERVVEEFSDQAPVSIVRPSIIESALVHPYPGWIEGFKMAEPLILAYGRGQVPEFPASPDAIVDIVPVDHVVNAILAVCATRPALGQPAYYHVSSGDRNPLTFAEVYLHIREYFSEHPFENSEKGKAKLPEWEFPGGDAVERLLGSSERLYHLADRALSLAPRGRKVRQLVDDLDRTKRRLDMLRRYLDLYKPYTLTELRFTDDKTLALHDALDEQDKELWGFDTSVVDWRHYFVDVHCPSITKPIRAMDAARARRGRAELPGLRDLKRASDVVAVFDLEGTLIASNVVETYLWLRLPELRTDERLGEVASLLRKLPGYLIAERKDRGSFLRALYRRYAGASIDELNRLVDESITHHMLERVSSEAIARIRAHREAGHRTVMITGSVRPITRPLAPLFDEIIAADLAVDESGLCTGYLSSPPMVGESRAAWMKWYTGRHGLDLGKSFAYADSHSDLPMLRSVNNAVAVSPDVHLQRFARANRWPIVDWASRSLASRFTLPRSDRT